MNERIQELKDQCYISVADQDGDTEYDMDKFARLLILKCINLLVTVDDHEVAKEIVYKRLGVEL
jgi:hypothetical protein